MGQRLDKYILKKYPELSRSYIKDRIKLGYILIGNKKVKPSYNMRDDDQVVFAPDFALPLRTKIKPNPEIKLKIIYEDGNVIVVDKPAGISVHPRQTKNGAPIEKELGNTLVSALLAYYPPLADVGDQPEIRPGIVHRLDKNTSGVMIVAKNQESFEKLKQQFKERKTRKKYIALVCGSPEKDRGVIKTYLTRSATEPDKQKVVAETDKIIPRTNEREATTKYRVIKKFKNYTLIEAHPKTGRLHQIRVQFAWLGHPVAGDEKYGSAKLTQSHAQRGGRKDTPAPTSLKRQFLHATELEISLPGGQKKKLISPMPQDLNFVLESLEKKLI